MKGVRMNHGIIRQFKGSWLSGIAFISIEDCETGIVSAIPCDNAPTVRALQSAFGDTITDGHTANGNGYKGKEIYWDYDILGLVFGSFTPVSAS